MSLNGVGALCKSGGRSRINRFTVESRRIFGSCDRNHGGRGLQIENRRSLMILNPSGQNIRGQNISAAPPPKQILQDEDKIAQVLKIISNLELQKPVNNIDLNVPEFDSSAEKDKLVDPEEHIGVNNPEKLADVETKVNVSLESVTPPSKEDIDAIVEKVINQDVDVDQIVKASSSEVVDDKLEAMEPITKSTDAPEVKLNDEDSIIETITKPDPTVVSQTEKADIPSEDPHKAKVIQSENKKFSMSITSADQQDEDSSSSSSDSDSDSSSSSSDEDEDHKNSASPAIGKTQLTKISGAELSVISSFHYRRGRIQYYSKFHQKPKKNVKNVGKF